MSGLPPSHKIDTETGSLRICEEVLKERDYQMGKTKVFLKDEHELFLEQERDRALAEKILILQKHIRGWFYRRRFIKQRQAAIIIQKCWKSYQAKRSYLIIRRGYLRMQAVLRSKVLTARYRHIRSVITRLQARCRGYYVRRYKEDEFIIFISRVFVQVPTEGEMGHRVHSEEGEGNDSTEEGSEEED